MNKYIITLLLVLQFSVMADTNDVNDTLTPDLNNVIEVIKKTKPSAAYAMVSFINADPVYGAGLQWPLSKKFGVGLEYRHTDNNVTYNSAPLDLTSHTFAGYLYYDLFNIKRLSFRADAGGGILMLESSTLKADETWVASARLIAELELLSFLSFQAWGGSVLFGSVDAVIGNSRLESSILDYPEFGIGLQISL